MCRIRLLQLQLEPVLEPLIENRKLDSYDLLARRPSDTRHRVTTSDAFSTEQTTTYNMYLHCLSTVCAFDIT